MNNQKRNHGNKKEGDDFLDGAAADECEHCVYPVAGWRYFFWRKNIIPFGLTCGSGSGWPNDAHRG